MAAATTPAAPQQTPKTPPSGAMPFDLSRPPVIEGFTPLPVAKDETFKDKLMRKTKENPFVPIGELVQVHHPESNVAARPSQL